jgi:hypothetical protein
LLYSRLNAPGYAVSTPAISRPNAAVQEKTFGQRRVPPPLFKPLPHDNPVLAFCEPYLDRLRDWQPILAAFVSARTVALKFWLGRLEAARRHKLGPIHPKLHSLKLDVRATIVRVLAYLGGICALSYLSAEMLRTAPIVEAAEPPMRPVWISLNRLPPSFELNLPDLGESPQHSIVRHAQGGGRKDIITYGEPGRSVRYVMMEVYRPGSELERFGDAASEIAARAATLGPAGAVRPSLPIETKFGTVETVEFRVGNFGVGHCIGVARRFDAPRVQIAGISCHMDSIANRSALACALDRLTLLSAGNDPDVGKLFADAELRRNFCGQRSTLLHATPKRPGDTGAPVPPYLRGRLN